VHQTGAIATLAEHARDNVFLADMRLGEVLAMVMPASAASVAARSPTRSRSVLANSG
jgi:hypothetical protein